MRIGRKNWKKNYFLFNWLCRYLLFLIICISTVSCHTLFKKKKKIPYNLNIYKTGGAFSGIFTLSTKKQKKYFTGDIFISEEGKIRLDLFVSLGVPVLTLLFDKGKVTCLFLQNKTFYAGADINELWSDFFPQSFKLSLLKDVLFDRIPIDKRWQCVQGKEGLPIQCQNQKWVIKWDRGKKRIILFQSDAIDLIFEYFSFSHEVNESLFSIEIPKHFKPVFLLK